MTNAEIIQVIRKEIICRIDKRHLSEQTKNELVSILSFLDTIESEKPMNPDGLEKDVERWFFNEISSKINVVHSMYYYFQECARRYAQWGAEHTPLPEDTVLFNKGVAEGKRLMMEDAVEGTITCHNLNRYILISGLDESLTYGDKVRLIIVKED